MDLHMRARSRGFDYSGALRGELKIGTAERWWQSWVVGLAGLWSESPWFQRKLENRKDFSYFNLHDSEMRHWPLLQTTNHKSSGDQGVLLVDISTSPILVKITHYELDADFINKELRRLCMASRLIEISGWFLWLQSIFLAAGQWMLPYITSSVEHQKWAEFPRSRHI